MSHRSEYSESANKKMVYEVRKAWKTELNRFERNLYRYFLAVIKGVEPEDLDSVKGEPWMAMEALAQVRRLRRLHWSRRAGDRLSWAEYSSP